MNTRIQLMDLKRGWTAPEGLDRARPREVKLTGGGKALVILAISLVVAAIGAGFGLGRIASRQADEARRFREESVTTRGQIIRLRRTGGEQKRRWVVYRFTADGRTFERSARVSLRVWKGLSAGSEIPVRYLPSNPDLNYPLDLAGRPMPGWIPFLAAGGLATFGILATLPLRNPRRLLAEGRPAPAIVKRHGEIVRSTHGAVLGRKFHYEFPLLNGAIGNGQSGPIKNPPPVGSTLCVLYDPESPHKNAPYPLSLVKPARLSSR